ncbi:MAG: hypothetical protein QOK27_1638 [Gemmatimonadales bacterium]|nr:hypothetical protein [Gemmatimonadales bacterium]
MYRVELSPGEETAFRSIEELAVAIKRGVVTSRARIWHSVSGKWLPIEFHPHYKIAASMQLTTADLVAGPPIQKLELLTLGEQMDPPRPPIRPAVQPEEPRVKRISEPVKRISQPVKRFSELVKRTPESVKRTPESVKRSPEPEPKPHKKAGAKSRRPRSGGKSLRIALAGALFIGCAHLAYSAASTALRKDIATRPSSHRRLVMTPENIAEQGPETTAAAVLPGLRVVPRSGVRSSSAARPAPSRPVPTESAVQDEAAPLESRSEAATPAYDAFRADSASGIQPAPTSISITAPAPLNGDSLARKMVDSTGKKTLTRILRTIGGTPATEPNRPKR